MSRNGSGAALESLVSLYQWMVTSRELDRVEANYTGRGEAAFYVSGAGHEATAALAPHLTPEDWLCCHYRDKALMLARGMGPEEMFRSLFARDSSFSRGKQMHGLLSYAAGRIVSLATPVGNNALHAVGIAETLKDRKIRIPNETGVWNPIVLCSLGDGTCQEGEVMEAIGHAVREHLGVLFLIQDNSLAISTRTRGRTFFSLPGKDPGAVQPADSFYGIPIRFLNGKDPEAVWNAFKDEVRILRAESNPRIVVLEVERIASHSNADDQRVYRSQEEIETIQTTADPIQNLRQRLVAKGMEEAVLQAAEAEIRHRLEKIAEAVRAEDDPKSEVAAVRPYEGRLNDRQSEQVGTPTKDTEASFTMLEAIREVLRARLRTDPRVVLFGQDIEYPKGDVFGVTKGLSTAFPGRVRNSPLAESTIVGASIGRALAGDLPVAFLQFADFLPVAYNQIFSELACMYWRTDGSWQVPVILMVSCGAYRPGLGPFHASTLEAVLAHTPGLDVFMPSTAADAAGLLNAAFESRRPTVFFYPKTLLNDREQAVAGNPAEMFVPPAKARIVRPGQDMLFVGWGNTVQLCERAAAALEDAGIRAEVIDLRTLMPWDTETVVASASKTGNLIVTHEDTHTAGMGAEVVATVAEALGSRVKVRRITRPDTWVPFHFKNQLEVLPSYKKILEAAVEMLGGSLRWEKLLQSEEGIYIVEAIGSSPADESVTILEWKVKPGDTVFSGQKIAELEADKAAIELNAPLEGTVEEVLVQEGEMVKVGTPLLKLAVSLPTKRNMESPLSVEQDEEKEGKRLSQRPILREDPGIPKIQWLKDRTQLTSAPQRSGESQALRPIATENLERQDASSSRNRSLVSVACKGIAGVRGSRQVSNAEISALCPDWQPEDIVKRTGIATRPWIAEGESATTLAIQACRKLFQQTETSLEQIQAIICATGTPVYNTPSMAALVHYGLGGGGDAFLAQASDINAACSGYLYGLQQAYDFLQVEPDAAVLLVTTEVLSSKTDHRDPVTAPLFADAATATLLVGGAKADGLPIKLRRPLLAAKGEPGQSLRVPVDPREKIYMEGQKVFLEAVKGMMRMLDLACEKEGLQIVDLDLVVPHQANQRIINAVRQKYRIPSTKVYSNIAELGNTSSSTIPLCLEQILAPLFGKQGDAAALAFNSPYRIGLTAFGGGYTFGGAILQIG